MQTISVMTNGCPENRIDGARLRQVFLENGWRLTNNYRDASYIIFNACALTQSDQESSVRMIEHIQQSKLPGSELIVWGCLPRINRERLLEVFNGATFAANQTLELVDYLGAAENIEKIHANYLIETTHPEGIFADNLKKNIKDNGLFRSLCIQVPKNYLLIKSRRVNVYRKETFCIKVSTGCLSACSYCAVKNSRGRLVSKPIELVLEEFKDGLRQGYSEFALLGTDVGSYGMDRGSNLCHLLGELLSSNGNFSIRVRNINSRHLLKLLPEYKDCLSTGKISYMCAPVQSGSNRMLKLMNRNHNIEDYREAINTIKSIAPQIQIRTQVMVGFPTETDKDFNDTLRLLDDIHFDFVECYVFTPRPNTKADSMTEGRVPYEIARRRYEKVIYRCFMNDLKSFVTTFPPRHTYTNKVHNFSALPK